MLIEYDVIIVGAGPAGTSCAYHLKRLNSKLKVLLLDKATFPRYKTCGGGVSPDIFNYFDFDLTEVIEHRSKISEMVFEGNRIKADSGEVLMVRREVFDHFLLDKCIEKGIETCLGCEVTMVETHKIGVCVETSLGKFTSKVVVIAEGARGQLAKKLGVAPKNNIVAGMEYEHYAQSSHENLEINFDQAESFYAWNFPKSDGLSLGVGALIKGRKKNGIGLPKQLKQYVQQFDVESLNKKHLYGHPIQLYSGRRKLVHDRTVLIGEIAGCVDPLTAEGIRPAIKSGYLAASVLNKAITSGRLKKLKQYNAVFHREIGKDFQYARFVSYCLYKKRPLILPLLHSKQAISAFMRVFEGSMRYQDYISKKRIVQCLKRLI